MEATIHISGVIGDFGFEDKYTFSNLSADVREARNNGATSFRFVIDSDGGLVDEGFLMASYIQSLSEPTTAVAVRVFSIANIIFFACDNRESDQNGMFMLHQAWATIDGNSDDLRKYADVLEKEDDRIANYIASRTGLDYEAVKGLMGTDRFIEKGEAERLGFFNKATSLRIAALYNNKQDNFMSKLGDKVLNALKNIEAMISGKEQEQEQEQEQEAQVIEAGEQEETVTISKVDYDALQAVALEKKELEQRHTDLEAKVLNIEKLISSNARPLAKHPRFNQEGQNPSEEAKKEERELFGADKFRKQVLKN